MDAGGLIKKYGYGPVLYIAVSLLILSLSWGAISQYKQIPSPIYGGDYYKGLGDTISMIDGGDILGSAQMSGEMPLAPWFYFLLVAAFAKITGMAAMAALINFALLADIFTLIIFYFLIKEVTGNKFAPSLAVLLVFLYGFSPVLKYSFFSSVVSMPLFVLMLYLFLRKPDMKMAALAGIALGIAGLSNSQAFFAAFLIFGLAAIVFLLPKIFDFKSRKLALDAEGKQLLKQYAIIFAIGFLLSLLFWFKPIFVFHGLTPNNIQDYTTPDVRNPANLWGSIRDILLYNANPYTGGLLWVFSLFALAGLYYAVRTHNELGPRFTLVLAAACILAIIHPLITLPLFNLHFVNFMMDEQMYPSLLPLLAAFGVVFANMKLEGRNWKLRAIAFAVLLLIAYLGYSDFVKTRSANQWEQAGQQPLQQPFVDLGSYIRSNTGVNDVFLTDNEDAFMMNALSGRKVVTYRRTHASPYADMNARMADAAVMVYGTNDATRIALLAKYNVKYLLWSNRWVLNEFQFDSSGKLSGFFDPLSVPANASNKAYWDSNGVRSVEMTMPLDPAARQGVPTYDQLIAVPYNLSYEPLYPGIYADFQLVKTISYGGQDMFRIYEIKNS